jgi:glycosyltransferase involved in cell wall biosynthesis
MIGPWGGLWSLDTQTVVARYGKVTRERLQAWQHTAGSANVLVPTRNGAADLPRLLVSLAMQDVPVHVWVAPNNCTDSTAEVAEALGAHIVEAPAGKLSATKASLRAIDERQGLGMVLLTDDDVVQQPRWARTMTALAHRLDERRSRPVGVFGSVVFVAGKSFAIDALRTGYDYALDIKKRMLGRSAIARGYNMVLGFDEAGRLRDAIYSLPDDLYPGEDTAMGDKVLECGGRVSGCLDLRAIPSTRNDRVSTVAEFLAMRGGGEPTAARKQRALLYMRDLP